MKFEYQMSITDEKLFLMQKHKITNRIYLILFTIAYFIILFSFTKDNFFVSISLYIIFICILYTLLHLTNIIFTNITLKIQKRKPEEYLKYTFIIDEKGITQKHQNTKITLEWNNIKKIILGKKYSIIYPKNNNIAFLFQRKTMNEQYETLLNILKQKK